MNSSLNYIDLFAGCGGLSLGLHNAGWNGIFAIEKSPDAFKTLKHNLMDKKNHFAWPSWLPKTNLDIKFVLKNYEAELIGLRGKVDMVTGGPPCQGFSTAGKRDEKDKRNTLIKDYIKFIRLVKPKILFFENVRGFTLGFNKNKTLGKQYSTFVSEQLKNLNYDVSGQIIDFSKFGIPQKRCRFILVGILNEPENPSAFFAEDFFYNIIENRSRFLAEKKLKSTTTLSDAISDLKRSHGEANSPDTKGFKAGKYAIAQSNYQKLLRIDEKKGNIADSHRFVNHKQHIVDRFQDILLTQTRNTTISDAKKAQYKTKKRTIVPLNSNSPSPTITTLPDDYIHYCEPRILTVREYARIQSFPDDFEFKGKYTTGGINRVKEVPRYTQIGNAIPPMFGELSGIALKEII